MVLRLHQHNIGYTADGFYRSDDPTNSVKALKEGGQSSTEACINNCCKTNALTLSLSTMAA